MIKIQADKLKIVKRLEDGLVVVEAIKYRRKVWLVFQGNDEEGYKMLSSLSRGFQNINLACAYAEESRRVQKFLDELSALTRKHRLVLRSGYDGHNIEEYDDEDKDCSYKAGDYRELEWG